MNLEAPAWTLITVTYNNMMELREWWAGNDLGGARWIVVDNNSGDDTANYAESLGAEVIRLQRNIGFSRANNVALKLVTSNYVAFVNPDVRVDATTFPSLGRLATQHNAIVCPQLCNPDGSLQPNGRGLPYLTDKIAHRGIALPGSSLARYTPDTSAHLTYVAWAMGAAICGESLKIQASGGWDERYFLYYEDHAFGLNAWCRGQAVILAPEAKWTHAWKRETKTFRVKPWARELASAARFYRQYPELIFARSSSSRSYWRGAERLFGQSVTASGGDTSEGIVAGDKV